MAATIATIAADSAAARADLSAGMRIASVNGQPLRDILDWLWLSDGEAVELEILEQSEVSQPAPAEAVSQPAPAEAVSQPALAEAVSQPALAEAVWQPTLAEAASEPALAEAASEPARFVEIKRELHEPWGIEFNESIFDEVHTCVNACTFCFMDMLPEGMRESLYLRDDDYRLSFLQGNFVTLTNLSDADAERIIEQRLMPLHISLHALDTTVRYQLMGANAARGIERLEQLLAAGIEMHAQIVLLPGINDGQVLDETLAWCLQQRGILSVGIVPYAYTRYARMQKSFTPAEARALIDRLTALAPRVQLADEWFLLAERDVPAAGYYGDFSQYEDGLGMLRSFIDDWQGLLDAADNSKAQPVNAANSRHAQPGEGLEQLRVAPFLLISGEAFAPTLSSLVATSSLCQVLQVLSIKNRFFGGCVSVTGLLTATDIIEQVAEVLAKPTQPAAAPPGGLPGAKPNALLSGVLLPSVIFNDDGLTLDGYTADELRQSLGSALYVVPCTGDGLHGWLYDFFEKVSVL